MTGVTEVRSPTASVPSSVEVHPSRRRRESLAAFALVVTVAAVIALVPVLFDHRFYYNDDTATAAIGFWDHVGRALTAGRLTWIQPELWSSGNGALDAQHGNWSPVLLLVSLLASTAQDFVVFVTVLKVVLLMVTAAGVWLLARTYMRPWWAVVPAVVAPFNGVTSYLDSPSWVILLLSFSILPFYWWALRRVRSLTALPAIVFAVLLIGLGFAQSVLMLALVSLAVLAEELVRRRWRSVVDVCLVGVAAVSFTVAVFLPGALSSAVTLRDQRGIANDDNLGGSIDFLATAFFPTAQPTTLWVWGAIAPAPLAYITWALVLLPFVPWRRIARPLAALWPLYALAVVTLLLVIGPTLIGPTRWPVRYWPLLSLTVALVLGVVLARAHAAGWRIGRARVVVAAAIVAWGAYAAFSNDPLLRRAPIVGIGVCVVAVGATVLAVRTRRMPPAIAVPAAIALASVLVAAGQHAVYPRPVTPDYNIPETRAALEAVQPEAVAPSVVVGTLRSSDPADSEYTQEVLLGNAWLVGDSGAQNLYQFLGRRGYTDEFCIDFQGATCPGFLADLFTRQPTTGMLLVDQLGVNTLVIAEDTLARRTELLPQTAGLPPAGWHVAAVGDHSETWVRDDPAACTDGGLTWASPGVEATTTSVDAETIRVRIDAAPVADGRLAFCRLQWPGYVVDGGGTVTAVDGYLLGVDLHYVTPGQTITVSYRLPGLSGVVVALLLVVLSAVAAVLVRVIRRRRRPSVETE